MERNQLEDMKRKTIDKKRCQAKNNWIWTRFFPRIIYQEENCQENKFGKKFGWKVLWVSTFESQSNMKVFLRPTIFGKPFSPGGFQLVFPTLFIQQRKYVQNLYQGVFCVVYICTPKCSRIEPWSWLTQKCGSVR